MSDLKPCPFCGCNSVSFTLDHNQGSKWGYAECDGCGASGPETRTNYCNDEHQEWHEHAVDEWNTRKGDEEIERLNKENAELRATVEVLRGQMERFGLGIDEFHRNICNKLVSKTPAQHLNDLKANVVNECADSFGDRPIDYGEIKEYAQQLRRITNVHP